MLAIFFILLWWLTNFLSIYTHPFFKIIAKIFIYVGKRNNFRLNNLRFLLILGYLTFQMLFKFIEWLERVLFG
ncbi:hypothetical protein C3V43_13825 [Bacteroides heparinolyticus]|nr:hypothetical protein C3V43_13825 [Bacteroides heparinolyticus]